MRTEKEVHAVLGGVLKFLDDDDSRTEHPDLSFEAGVLAALDWVAGANSIYADLVEDMMEDQDE